MKELNITTKTYEYEGGFRFDLVIDEAKQEYEVFLYHENYGIKEMMFGGMIGTDTIDQILEMIVNNLLYESYIEDYLDTFMD